MANLTGKKLNKLLSIEISENDIICVELFFLKETISIKNAFRINIPVFQDVNKTVTLFKQTLKSLNIKTKEFAVGFSMQYLRLLPIPIPLTIPLEEITQIIVQEGNIDLKKEYLTWIPLNNTKRQDPDGVSRYDVLGISLHGAQMDFVNQIVKSCNLKLVSVTPSFLTLGFFLPQEATNNLLSTLWVSQIRSEFVVWSGQEPIYEHLFLTHQLNDQVFQSVNYIQSQLAGTQVVGVFPCGTYANETNLSQLALSIQQFTLPPYFALQPDVLKGLSITEIINSIGIGVCSSNHFPYITPNFLFQPGVKPISDLGGIFKQKPRIQIKREIRISLPFISSLDPVLARFIIPSLIIVLISILCSFYINNFMLPKVKTKLLELESKMNITQLQLAKLLNIEKTNKVLLLKSDYFSNLVEKRKAWSKILREVADMTPKNLWIDRLEIKNNVIDVFGRALDVNAVANFSINLNHTAKLLGNSQIVALRKYQEEGVDLIEYQVNAQVMDKTQLVLDKDKKEKQETKTKT